MHTSDQTRNVADLSFMKWIGMDIDIIDAPILRHFIVNAKRIVNVRYLEITATLQVSRPSAAYSNSNSRILRTT